MRTDSGLAQFGQLSNSGYVIKDNTLELWLMEVRKESGCLTYFRSFRTNVYMSNFCRYS